ncbi:MAG: glycoside hydrolase family 3 C-terminal domain-containing protein [Christensenellaceae bacterium]|jgi:beta-glucosidase|nr:glycoside hydrolase family 3 C-terminal domain-containing protein [Christensenellaceae bacterium]
MLNKQQLIDKLLEELTVPEKALLCSGRKFWYTRGLRKRGIEPYMVSDGPHGLRKQSAEADNLGINDSVKATCFPPACSMASTWNLDMIYNVGKRIGEEAKEEKLGIVLGPGANIKRSPLCGRNFEYYSEDPYLSGKCAAALIRGIQSEGAGTSLKHFATNNQENDRLRIDAIVDERALREIYLTSFEIAVKEGEPYTLMCAYNRLNGEFLSENKKILNDILRDEWGFEGYVMTDWGAIFDRVKALKAGLDLEMPGGSGESVFAIVDAVASGSLTMDTLDKTVRRLLEANLRINDVDNKGFKYDRDEHHEMAKKAAIEGAVLLKNEGDVLPLNKDSSIIVMGAFFKTAKYQGGGSSHINAHKVVSPFDAFTDAGIDFKFVQGYNPNSEDSDESVIEEAIAVAKKATGPIIVFAGVPLETEGVDRESMAIPKNQNTLIDRLIGLHKEIIVCVYGGAPIEMPWVNGVNAILQMYLPGQAGGAATYDLIFGVENPSGKLAETFPYKLSDTPCYKYFPQGPKTVEYRESIYVGYRYYDSAKVDVCFPFGYGLSYTKFEYSDLECSASEINAGDKVKVSCKVTNIGNRQGKEVVQLYVRHKSSKVFMADKELKGFDKPDIAPGETATVEFELSSRSFAYYNVKVSNWVIDDGEYEILIGASSADIKLSTKLKINAKEVEAPYNAGAVGEYYCYLGTASNEAFKEILGHPIPSSEYLIEPIRWDTTLSESRVRFWGRVTCRIATFIAKRIIKDDGDNEMAAFMKSILYSNPLRPFATVSGGMVTINMMEGGIDFLNGKVCRGIRKIIKAYIKNNKQDKILKKLEE